MSLGEAEVADMKVSTKKGDEGETIQLVFILDRD